jgi:hypothetical protein
VDVAWVDEDDENLKVRITDVARLRKLRQSAKEVTVSGQEYTERLRQQ